MAPKPRLSFWQIWNMCFGFLGIQFGFALQNANLSRIFQTLGANLDDMPILWVAAPLTGLLVQPIVGHLSDRTWNRLGRRRPYLLAGAVLASLALFAFPDVPALWMAAAMLWVLDASINVSMEPFRALVGDQLVPAQRPLGYAMQSFFIGTGAVVASMLPFLLEQVGVANTAAPGHVPDTVRYAFQAGAVVLLAAVGWTALRTREYSPAQLAGFDDQPPATLRALQANASRRNVIGSACLLGGLCAIVAIRRFGLHNQLYILAICSAAYGIALLASALARGKGMFATIMHDLHAMPATMRRLATVQFFSWFALFAMWIYATPAVTEVHFGSTDPASPAYNQGANWVGVLFAGYNGFAALAAMVIPLMVRRWGLRLSHLLNTTLGGLGLLSMLWIRDPYWLMLSMAGVGFAWASILSLPYALLSDSIPAGKMGVYMGLFNVFIVIPQLVAASVLGALLKYVFGGHPINALAIGGVSLIIAGLCTLRVRDPRPA